MHQRRSGHGRPSGTDDGRGLQEQKGRSMQVPIFRNHLHSGANLIYVLEDFSSFNSSVFELIKAALVVLGLVVQLFIIGTMTSLIRNTAPPTS